MGKDGAGGGGEPSIALLAIPADDGSALGGAKHRWVGILIRRRVLEQGCSRRAAFEAPGFAVRPAVCGDEQFGEERGAKEVHELKDAHAETNVFLRVAVLALAFGKSGFGSLDLLLRQGWGGRVESRQAVGDGAQG